MYRPPSRRSGGGEKSLTAVNNRTGEINDPHAAVGPAAPPGGRQYPEEGCGKQIAGGVGLNCVEWWWERLARLTGVLRGLADAGDAGEAGQLRLQQLLLRHLAACCKVEVTARLCGTDWRALLRSAVRTSARSGTAARSAKSTCIYKVLNGHGTIHCCTLASYINHQKRIGEMDNL